MEYLDYRMEYLAWIIILFIHFYPPADGEK